MNRWVESIDVFFYLLSVQTMFFGITFPMLFNKWSSINESTVHIKKDAFRYQNLAVGGCHDFKDVYLGI